MFISIFEVIKKKLQTNLTKLGAIFLCFKLVNGQSAEGKSEYFTDPSTSTTHITFSVR